MKMLIIFLILLVSCGKEKTIEQHYVSVDKYTEKYYEVKTLYVDCISNDFEYEEFELTKILDNASNLNIKLYKEYSTQHCYKDENYGLIDTNIWCSDGCRARFKITYNLEVL
jgi:hypothetical protein